MVEERAQSAEQQLKEHRVAASAKRIENLKTIRDNVASLTHRIRQNRTRTGAH